MEIEKEVIQLKMDIGSYMDIISLYLQLEDVRRGAMDQ